MPQLLIAVHGSPADIDTDCEYAVLEASTELLGTRPGNNEQVTTRPPDFAALLWHRNPARFGADGRSRGGTIASDLHAGGRRPAGIDSRPGASLPPSSRSSRVWAFPAAHADDHRLANTSVVSSRPPRQQLSGRVHSFGSPSTSLIFSGVRP